MPNSLGELTSWNFSSRVGLTAFVAAFLAFSIFAVSAAYIEYFTWDLQITRWLQTNSSQELQTLMIWVSKPANGWNPWVLVTVVGLLLWRFRLSSAALVMVLGVAVGGFVNRILKFLIARPRPDESLVQVFTDYAHESYPSGHVVFFTQFFGFLIVLGVLYLKRLWILYLLSSVLIAMILLVGVSRVCLGAHWSSDVIGGYIIGSLWLALMVWFYLRRKGKEDS
jgi:undecaprenyl-diphosphatase